MIQAQSVRLKMNLDCRDAKFTVRFLMKALRLFESNAYLLFWHPAVGVEDVVMMVIVVMVVVVLVVVVVAAAAVTLANGYPLF